MNSNAKLLREGIVKCRPKAHMSSKPNIFHRSHAPRSSLYTSVFQSRLTGMDKAVYTGY